MKSNKYFYGAVTVILLGLSMVIYFKYVVKKPIVTEDKIYKKGNESTQLIKGEMKEEIKKESFSDSVKIFTQSNHSPSTDKKNSVVEKVFSDSSYNLKIKIEAAELPDSLLLSYDLEILNKSFFRVDTLRILRVDTLLIEKVVYKAEPFYKSFWFGAGVGAAVVGLIVYMVK